MLVRAERADLVSPRGNGISGANPRESAAFGDVDRGGQFPRQPTLFLIRNPPASP